MPEYNMVPPFKSPDIWYGTQTDWNNLVQSEKAKYDLAAITDTNAVYVVGNGSSTPVTVSTSGGIVANEVAYDSISTMGTISLSDAISDEIENLKEDNLNTMEDMKSKLAEYEARIQKLESEVEILKSHNSNMFPDSNNQNLRLEDFF